MTIFNLLLSTDKGVVPDSLPYVKMKPLYEETKAQLLFSRLEVMINASYEELLQKNTSFTSLLILEMLRLTFHNVKAATSLHLKTCHFSF